MEKKKLKFTDPKTRQTFETDQYELVEREVQGRKYLYAVAVAPSGVKTARLFASAEPKNTTITIRKDVLDLLREVQLILMRESGRYVSYSDTIELLATFFLDAMKKRGGQPPGQ
ncbi:MAG: hypothetical protein QW247_10720 [Pyrobaculum sp.]